MSRLHLFYTISGVINVIACTSLAIVLVSRNARSHTVRLFAMWLIELTGWSVCYHTWTFMREPALAEFWVRTTMIWVAPMPATFTHLFLELAQRPLPRRVQVINYALCWTFAAITYTPWYAPYGAPGLLFFPVWPYAGPGCSLQFAHFVLNFFGAELVLYHSLRDERPVQRRALTLIFWANMLMLLTGGSNWLPWFRHLIPIPLTVPPSFAPAASILVALYAWAIVRYQVMNLRLVITQTGLLLGVYLIVLGVPFALAVGGESWFGSSLGRYWWMVPLSLSTVLATVGPFAYARLRRQTEEQLRRELAQKAHEASVDALTGAMTRRAFMERASEQLRQASERDRLCAILMIDLDLFKQTNDTHGHPVGDAVLQEVAARLGRTLRQADLLGRYGGEEFIILLPDTDDAQALVIAERLRQTVSTTPITTGASTLTQTLSLGLAILSDGTPTLATLIAKADAALYAAKRAGRNRVATT